MENQSEKEIKTYSSKELAAILQSEGDTEMTSRKIHYYRQIGLLPDLMTINNKNYYTDEHLDYLRAARTMKKTGESLDGIKATLNSLDTNTVRNIGDKMSYYSTQNLISTETYNFNSDISFTFSNQVQPQLRNEIINSVSNVLKKHQSTN